MPRVILSSWVHHMACGGHTYFRSMSCRAKSIVLFLLVLSFYPVHMQRGSNFPVLVVREVQWWTPALREATVVAVWLLRLCILAFYQPTKFRKNESEVQK